jgi:hypothetical protein
MVLTNNADIDLNNYKVRFNPARSDIEPEAIKIRERADIKKQGGVRREGGRLTNTQTESEIRGKPASR